MSNYIWVEKYRPSSLDTYIGNEHLKSKVEIYLESGDLPHLLLYGKAGTGKTTLAKILVNNIECDYLYINASDENSVDTVMGGELNVLNIDNMEVLNKFHGGSMKDNLQLFFLMMPWVPLTFWCYGL